MAQQPAWLDGFLERHQTYLKMGFLLVLVLLLLIPLELIEGLISERAQRRNLVAQVLFARQYARLVFDRPLHDRLLREVMDADPNAPGLTLANTLAREQALLLLDDADDYF